MLKLRKMISLIYWRMLYGYILMGIIGMVPLVLSMILTGYTDLEMAGSIVSVVCALFFVWWFQPRCRFLRKTEIERYIRDTSQESTIRRVLNWLIAGLALAPGIVGDAYLALSLFVCGTIGALLVARFEKKHAGRVFLKDPYNEE